MQPNAVMIGLGTAAMLVMMCLTSCAKTVYPVTAGSYKSLPQQPARIVVWGATHAETKTAVIAWLQNRGLVVIDGHRVHKASTDRTTDQGAVRLDEPEMLQAARSFGADYAVFVETSGAMTPAPQPWMASPTDGQVTSVMIRGVDLKSGEVEWNAQAVYPHLDEGNDGAASNLACQALATVWGFRPAGYHEIASADMCHIQSPGQKRSTSRQRLGRAEHRTAPPR